MEKLTESFSWRLSKFAQSATHKYTHCIAQLCTNVTAKQARIQWTLEESSGIYIEIEN